jgi:hypothetical protein
MSSDKFRVGDVVRVSMGQAVGLPNEAAYYSKFCPEGTLMRVSSVVCLYKDDRHPYRCTSMDGKYTNWWPDYLLELAAEEEAALFLLAALGSEK